jgi:hypothetical protein
MSDGSFAHVFFVVLILMNEEAFAAKRTIGYKQNGILNSIVAKFIYFCTQ